MVESGASPRRFEELKMEIADNNNTPVTEKMDYDDDSIGVVNLKPTMLGNSRRKQSKPIRVADSQPPQQARNTEPKFEPKTESPKNFDCRICSQGYESYEDLAWHQYESHGLINSKFGENETGERFENETDNPVDTEDPREMERELEPGEVVRKAGVFHMDSYCDKCDREFCNKYFFKAHLANKHGIYDDLPSPPRAPSPLNMTTSDVRMATSDVTKPSTPLPPSSLPMLSLGGVPRLPDYPKLEFPSLPKPADEKKRSIEDFCELCQKHFCNKYYLRKHKMDVHGIHSDPYSVRRRLGMGSGGSDREFHSQPPPSYSTPLMPQHMLMNPFGPMMALPPDPLLFPRYPLPGVLGFPHSKEPAEPTDKSGEKRDEEKSRDPEKARDEQKPFSHTHFIDELMSKYERNVDRRERHHASSDESRSEEDARSPPKVSPRQDAPAERDGRPADPTPRTDQVPRSEAPRPDPYQFEPRSEQSSKLEPPLRFSHTPRSEAPRSEPERQERKPDHPRTCEVCLKVFADKYSLRMHKLNIHDIPRTKDSDRTIKSEPISLPFPPSMPEMRYPPLPPSLPPFVTSAPSLTSAGLTMTSAGLALTSSPDMDAMASMYGSMAAAKLADRVTCDICNKDVCNKYFLKTHKVKMHGIDPSTIADLPSKEKTPEKEEIPLPGVMSGIPQGIPQMPPLPGVPFPPTSELAEAEAQRREELLKLGIDPESYCEICRKEFCSKYFLRTHKLNMHGIPTDKPGNRKEDREISRREIENRERMMQHNFGLPLGFNPVLFGDMKEKSMYPFLPTSPFKPNLKSFDEESLDSDNRSENQKMKDPANSIRVKCELCNKELCNKYFLRTHKMKKHGIVDDVLSEGQQRKLLEMQRQGLFPVVSYNGFPKHESDSKSPMDEMTSREMTSQCSICQESFMNQEMLHLHMVMTHGKMERSAICQICGLVCKDQLGLQLHLIQEHDVTINITSDRAGSRQASPLQVPSPPPMVRDPLMDSFLERTVDSLSRDLSRDFESRDEPEAKRQFIPREFEPEMNRQFSPRDEPEMKKQLFSCSKCPFRTRIMNHLRAHQLKHRKSDHGLPARNFRCRQCKRKFQTRFSLRVHSSRCQKTLSQKLNLENGNLLRDSSEFIMQKFNIANQQTESVSNFAEAFVYLPVAEKVREPITVSLHLTPTER